MKNTKKNTIKPTNQSLYNSLNPIFYENTIFHEEYGCLGGEAHEGIHGEQDYETREALVSFSG